MLQLPGGWGKPVLKVSTKKIAVSAVALVMVIFSALVRSHQTTASAPCLPHGYLPPPWFLEHWWKSGIRLEIRARKSGHPESGQKAGPKKWKSRIRVDFF
jgi:hypothetical protein